MRTDILYIWFQMAVGVCSASCGAVLNEFSSIEEIYKSRDFSFLGEKRKRVIKKLCDKDTGEAFEVLKRCKKLGASVVGFYDESYPVRLRSIDTPPACLYCIGSIRDLNRVPCIAVVGTRKMSDYGGTVAEDFAYSFSKSGAVVVSGLAKGIDLCAHRGAIRAGGYTVGVLGTPIGVIYPKENQKAFETLYRYGLVISELYPGCPATRADFPNRNRIISGMCDATVVAEAGDGSGSLITARHAVQQGRKLYAIPGDIGVGNHGTNGLIKQGAAVATEPYDVISDLKLEFPDGIFSYSPDLTSRLRSYGIGPEQPREESESKAADQREPLFAETEKGPGDSGEAVGGDELDADGAGFDTVGGAALKKQLCDKPKGILEYIPVGGTASADELVRKSGLDMAQVLSELILLEIDGKVISYAGGRYLRPS